MARAHRLRAILRSPTKAAAEFNVHDALPSTDRQNDRTRRRLVRPSQDCMYLAPDVPDELVNNGWRFIRETHSIRLADENDESKCYSFDHLHPPKRPGSSVLEQDEYQVHQLCRFAPEAPD
jgi:hypothetical protein